MAGLNPNAAHMSALTLLLGLLVLPTIVVPVSGAIECEELPIEQCAFAVSSTGARCVLEKDVQNNKAPEYKCQTSIIMAERPLEWIESTECISTCGLQRLSVGLSTDALLERDFTRKLCFSECRSKCPNINDLYTKLAAEDGIYLPSLCESLKPRAARKLVRQVRQVQQEKPAVAPKEKVTVSKEVKIAEVAVATWAPAKSPAPTSAGWPVAAVPPVANVGEEPYPSAEAPSYEDDAEPPFYEELPPSPSYEEEPPSPAPLAALPPFYFSAPSPAPLSSPAAPSYLPFDQAAF